MAEHPFNQTNVDKRTDDKRTELAVRVDRPEIVTSVKEKKSKLSVHGSPSFRAHVEAVS